ncbi:hypothetical protein [Desertivirga xinjiangensis]|uniref:hypothetical protein n=1 Tax=Desertivirga xinjiangensis TaxID=539206 RepID=UPI00210DCA8A|nr:hypothetical protein [Pedobacter xinjiangensis]
MTRQILPAAIIALGLLAGCKKTDVTAGDSQVGYINFFNASEVLMQNAALSRDNFIMINDTVKGKRQPHFAADGDIRQFPFSVTASQLINEQIGNIGDLFWLPLKGNNRFTFTSVDRVFLTDTSLNIQPDTFTTLYLAESPVADDAYAFVDVPVETKGTAGKVRLQIINLSPDLGPLKAYLFGASATPVAAELPQSLNFGMHSKYAEVDLNLANNKGNLLLKICRSGSEEVLVSTAVPAKNHAVYTIFVRGFLQSATRRIKNSNTAYAEVTITPNLRATLRRTN